MLDNLKIVAFDADDTLWENETLFREAERKVASLLEDYGDYDYVSAELYKTESGNMEKYGFGAKAYMLSMIETAVRISSGKVTGNQIQGIISTGKEILDNPATPYPGVVETLSRLKESGRYTLAVLTKGDLLDQEKKLKRSGLGKYFDIVEIVSDKSDDAYARLLSERNALPEEFMMVGNSFKSDIDPVLRMGGYGIHIPAKVLWKLEHTEEYSHPRLFNVESISDILPILL